MNIYPETREEGDTEAITAENRYNLRPRPTKRNPKYTMVQIGQHPTIVKPHTHVMMKQLNTKEGNKKSETTEMSHY